MKNKLLIIFLLFISCNISNVNIKKESKNIIRLSYDYYFLKNNFIQYDLDYSIPYSELVFVKKTANFSTSITSSIKVLNMNKEIIYTDSWTNDITVNYFENTKSKSNYNLTYSFKIPVYESYDLVLVINDYENHKLWNFTKHLKSDKYEYLSDINLYQKENEVFKKINYTKNNQTNILDTIWIKYQIIDENPDTNGFSLEIKKYGIESSTLFKINTIENYKINFFPIPLDTSFNGKLNINYYYRDIIKNNNLYITDNKLINYDYNKLLTPVTYILNREEYLEYIDLDSLSKIDYIINYWSGLGSELFIEEFYSRIEYANNRFYNGLNDGSNTDMGKIFIIYGSPKNVENRMNESSQYEIWIYPNKRFVFINRFGYYECYSC